MIVDVRKINHMKRQRKRYAVHSEETVEAIQEVRAYPHDGPLAALSIHETAMREFFGGLIRPYVSTAPRSPKPKRKGGKTKEPAARRCSYGGGGGLHGALGFGARKTIPASLQSSAYLRRCESPAEGGGRPAAFGESRFREWQGQPPMVSLPTRRSHD